MFFKLHLLRFCFSAVVSASNFGSADAISMMFTIAQVAPINLA
jgi:hypothetical protein